MKSSVILTKILQEELKPVINSASTKRLTFEDKLAAAQKNLNEARTELLLRKSRLSEYKIASQVEPGFKITKPWTDVKAENVLKQLGAKPFKLGINPHGYELDASNDRLWFYSDGRVWSTNQMRELGYTIPGANMFSGKAADGEIVLWNEPGGESAKTGFSVGTIKKSGNKAVFVPSGENLERSGKETEEPAESNSWVDTLQTILDWAGIIPVIGDALDIINAIIYFVRGKYFEGFLSCIAIIPIIGSGIALTVKAAYKTGKNLLKLEKLGELIAKSIKTGKTDEFWAKLVKDGAIDVNMLSKLGPGIDSLADTLKSTHGAIESIPLIDSNRIIKQLDQFETWMHNSGRSIDDLAGAAERGGKKAIYGDVPAWVEKIHSPILRNFGNKLTFNLVPRLKRLPFFPTEKLAKITAGLETRFAREMSSNPTKLMAALKTSPNQNTLLKELQGMLAQRTSKLPKAAKADLYKTLNTAGLIKNNKIMVRTPEDWTRFLTKIKSNPSTIGLYDSAAEAIVNHAKKNNSIEWTIFKTDRLNNLKTVLSKDMIPGGSAWYKELDTTMRKNADIIWNEMQDMGETFGFKSQDEVNGVIWPILSAAASKVAPDWAIDFGNDLTDTIKKITGSPGGQAVLDQVKDTVGLSNDEEQAYDPEASKGGEFN
jgi:hypothetical protein